MNPIFPVALMLRGRPCLVLGGGRIATRKVRLLLDARAPVTVVAPEATPELQALSQAGTVRWIQRRFEPTDLDGIHLVYAATNNPAVNRDAAQLCRRHHIWCCIVDAGWRDGDFLTPATLRDGELTVSVSTGGRACRRSRLVRQSLARHLDSIRSAELLVLGTSHEELPLAVREPLHCAGERLLATGRMLHLVLGIHEFVLLNTCNRIELHAVGSPDPDAVAALKRLLGFDTLGEGQYYLKRGFDAFEHTCELCAGLRSQVPGENHIVAQMKEALTTAATAGWSGAVMQEWTSTTLHVAKDIRQATDPHLHGREIEDLAADYIGGLNPARLVILGTGRIGTGVLTKVTARLPSVQIDWIYHRQRPDLPPALAARVTLESLDTMPARLPMADAVISAMTSDTYVLAASHSGAFEHGRPVKLLDLAMPRNMDPDLATRPSVSLLDLDALKRWHRRENIDLSHLRALCRAQIIEHRAYYDKLVSSLQGWNAEQ